ncbi:MAG: alpha/beta fold hydrolase [Cyanobacteria bacterium J06626_18]
MASGAVLNGIAWMQARAMTHYVEGGDRTAKPESLSLAGKAWIVLTGVRLPRPTNERSPAALDLPYETHVIDLPPNERLETWFIPAENSRGVVLLFPPYGASKQTLLAQSQIFHELGYSTLLVDFRGVGGSSGSDTTLGVREGEDVAYAVRYAEQHWPGQPIVLYGASMGAVAVMRAIAHEGVAPSAVILESPFDSLLNTVRHRFDAMSLPSFPSAELIVLWGGWQQEINGFTHNPVEYACAINSPVLLLHGEKDRRVSLQDAQAIFEALPDQKQLVIFSATGHGSLASANPTQWRQHVQQLLNRQ